MPVALTLMDCVVAPVDHKYELAALPVSVTLPPSQNAVGPPAVMTGVAGKGLTVTAVAALVALQPLPSVVVTVKLPGVVTLIDGVVAPVDQRYEDAALAVSVTLPPAQNVVGPPAVIVGVVAVLTVTAVGALVALQPSPSVIVTE